MDINNQPLITVAVPVYNVQRYLHKCIESILTQSYTNLQIILVNDGSQDASGRICDHYALKDARINVIHIPNSGASVARNIAIDNAKGLYLCFVDADDYLPCNSITSLYQGIVNQQSELCCGAWAKITALHTKFNSYANQIYQTSDKQSLAQYLQVEEINGPVAKLYKTSIIQEHDLHFIPGIKIGEDAIFNYQYIQKCRCVSLIGECVYYYNKLNARSVTHCFYQDFYNCSFICAEEQAKNIVSEEYPQNCYLVQHIYCVRFISAMRYISYYELPCQEAQLQYESAYQQFYGKLDLSFLEQAKESIFKQTLDVVQCCKSKKWKMITEVLEVPQKKLPSITQKFKSGLMIALAKAKLLWIFHK